MFARASSTDSRVSSRRLLESAESYNRSVGHELEGFLSAHNGFIPMYPTKRSFPASHAPWDEVAASMPRLWRDVTLRKAIKRMPVLGASAEELPDEYVWRAAVAMAMFAHAFVRVEPAPAELPRSITVPWTEVSRRLGRRKPHMSYNDLIVYNHRLVDPAAAEPYVIENMELLVPSVDNIEERRFYLAQVEILARAKPIVTATIRAQEAAVRADDDALADELILMNETWRDIIELSFRKVDPNPLSATHVDQVIWSKTVAPLAVPIFDDVVGPGGEASPAFHLMDAFLGRKHKRARLAREVAEIREWFPSHHVAFLNAVEEVSVRDYVAASGNRRLQNLFATLFETYAGRRGYLGIHRTKVYGFLELAFKIGRNKTISGIVGDFKDGHWRTLDAILEESRLERFLELPPHVQQARIRYQEPAALLGDVTHVVLDTKESGVVYRPGDRVGVLPVNRAEAVQATLLALGAAGTEHVPLTAEWREALRYRTGYPANTETLPLTIFLSYAKLRPFDRTSALAFLNVTESPGLRAAMSGGTDKWELCDALNLLRTEGYDAARLVKADLSDPGALARLVPPEEFRMYSVSSRPSNGPDQVSHDLRLTVAQLRHSAAPDTGREGAELLGTSSTYLRSAVSSTTTVPLQMIRPNRFRLPRDPSRPVVMFAGGVGISPFLGFIAQRKADADAADAEITADWLFFGTRTQHHLYDETEIRSAVANGQLGLYVAYSAQDGGLRAAPGGQIQEGTHSAGRLHDVLAADEEAQRRLWGLMRSEHDGGFGAYFYICGRAEFAANIIGLLTSVAERFADGPERAQMAVPRLMAEGRLMQDIFTSWSPAVADEPFFDVSEVAVRTTPEAGQWLIIDGYVYDVTDFLRLHPGGPRILTESVGLDATAEYAAVLHHENSEINAMLAMYRLGPVRVLDLGPAHTGSGTSPSILYQAWVKLLHLVTAMSNALKNDWDFLAGSMTRGDDPEPLNALKILHAASAHQRFLDNYFTTMTSQEIPALVSLTLSATCVGLAFPPAQTDDLEVVTTSPQATAASHFAEQFRTAYQSVSDDPTQIDSDLWLTLRAVCEAVREQDLAFMAKLGSILRDGVIVFEQFGADAVRQEHHLIGILRKVPVLIVDYHSALLEALANADPDGIIRGGTDILAHRRPGDHAELPARAVP
ncbi:cytochrome b5 domain-containing protein [Streptomyces sp. 1222.5]|uniref:cytochrome b5 domain-containing protein n=1 Tax=Streptomyces sp. 1222.5 TaxID=1881026 RepID=UPI003EB6E815